MQPGVHPGTLISLAKGKKQSYVPACEGRIEYGMLNIDQADWAGVGLGPIKYFHT